MHASIPLGPVVWASLASMLLAQILKPFCALATGQPLRLGRMLHTGGMPSSHTALVTTLTLSIGLTEGASSTLFAMCLLFSGYFVFEATGLRQEVGEQAKVLNEMFDELYQTHHVDRRRLKELVGHTWPEVIGGGLIGGMVFALLRGWIAAG